MVGVALKVSKKHTHFLNLLTDPFLHGLEDCKELSALNCLPSESVQKLLPENF
jgi:hypothetical protein